MTSDDSATKLRVYRLLDGAFTSSSSLNDWLRPANAIHLVRLCIMLNLEAAERALDIANSAFSQSLVKAIPTENSSAALQGFRQGQENAKAILDILRYVRASLQKGLMLAKAERTVLRSVISALEAFSSYVSDFISFWMSDHGIYDPSQIHSFMMKIVDFYDHHPEILGENFDTLPDVELKALRTLLSTCRKETPFANVENKANYQGPSHSVGTSHISHKHHSLHIGSTIHHLVSSLDIRNHVYHVKLPSIFHHKDAPLVSVHPKGLDLDGLTSATELAFHLIATWCTHHFQSPSSSSILDRLSSEMIIYVRAIDHSIGSARCIFALAEDSLAIFDVISNLTEVQDVTEYLNGMHGITVRGLEESRHSLELFRDVRRTLIKLLEDADKLYAEEKTAIQERMFELESSKHVLEIFTDNVERYVNWWTRMNMSLDSQESISRELIKSNCSIRKQQLLEHWADLRTSFSQYADKTRHLRDTFPDLFTKSRQLDIVSTSGTS